MKKICCVTMIFASLLFVISCSNGDQDYSDFLSDKEGKYSLYIASDKIDAITLNTLEENDINNVKIISQDMSLEGARLDEIKELPTFIIFDTKGKVFKTNNEAEMFEFLHDNK